MVIGLVIQTHVFPDMAKASVLLPGEIGHKGAQRLVGAQLHTEGARGLVGDQFFFGIHGCPVPGHTLIVRPLPHHGFVI